jgi:hypothetical protein
MHGNKFVRTLDWRFWLALACAVMVAYLSFVGYSGVKASQVKDERIDHLIESLDSRSRQGAVDRAQAADDRAQAREDREAAQRERRALTGYIERLSGRQQELLAWLDENGIEIPTRFLSVVEPPRILVRQPKDTSPKPSQNKKPSQNEKPEDTSPGKSGTKGKGKSKGKAKGQK